VIAFASSRGGDGGLYVVRADGSQETLLADVVAYAPTWSPDGARLAVSCDATSPPPPDDRGGGIGPMDICIVWADGRGSTRLLDDPASDIGPTWAPDGETVTFTSFRDGDRTIPAVFQLRLDGSGLTPVVARPEGAMQPAWSPDGTRLAFVAGIGADAAVFVLDAGGAATRIAGGTDPRWSPDGTRLLHGTPTGEIVISGVDDGSRVSLGLGQDAEWSPDGASVACTRSDAGGVSGSEIVVVTVSDGSVVELGAGSQPTWSPDGTRVAFVATGLWVAEVASGTRVLLVADAGAFAPAWSPVGGEGNGG
jgi:TolB protein